MFFSICLRGLRQICLLLCKLPRSHTKIINLPHPLGSLLHHQFGSLLHHHLDYLPHLLHIVSFLRLGSLPHLHRHCHCYIVITIKNASKIMKFLKNNFSAKNLYSPLIKVYTVSLTK